MSRILKLHYDQESLMSAEIQTGDEVYVNPDWIRTVDKTVARGGRTRVQLIGHTGAAAGLISYPALLMVKEEPGEIASMMTDDDIIACPRVESELND
jgi:hypothetical protein